jgi:hypothetical protein
LENDPHLDGAENWEYFRLLERIDTPSIRAILRQLAQRSGSDSDAVLRDQDGLRASQLAYRELYERGDLWALPELIKVGVGGDKGFGHYMAAGHLLRYPRHQVADAVRRALGESPSPPRARSSIGCLGSLADRPISSPSDSMPQVPTTFWPMRLTRVSFVWKTRCAYQTIGAVCGAKRFAAARQRRLLPTRQRHICDNGPTVRTTTVSREFAL